MIWPWAAIASMTCACSLVAQSPSFVPAGAYSVKPSPMWLAQYQAAQDCSHVVGTVASVKWFLVPGKEPYFKDDEGHSDDGIWTYPHNIYIAQMMAGQGWLIRHESLHDIRQNGEHPVFVFGTECHAMIGFLDDDPSYRP